MIFYIILLCLHTCHSIMVTRGELFDTAKGEVVCRNTCTCQSPTATFFHLSGKEKCMGANGTGCLLKVDGYTTDVPLITHSMPNKTEFYITKDGGNLCPTKLRTNVTMLALTDQWEAVPTFMSNSILYSIANDKGMKVTFHAVWPGLLIKLEVMCKASNGNKNIPSVNCVLFKYEGTATYPITLSSFAPVSSTTTTPTTTATTTETTTATTTTTSKETNTVSKSNTKATHTSLQYSTPVNSTPTTHSETAIPSSPTTDRDNKDNRDIAMAAGFTATVILILVTIIIILICYKRKLDRKSSSRKVAYTKSNIEENTYDKVNKKEEDAKKRESEVIEFPNTTYGNKINLYTKVGDESEEHKIQKQDSHYYNTMDINKNLNYYNVYAEKETSHVDNKPINTMNVNEYDQIWSNNYEDEKKVESGKSSHGDDKSSRDDVDDEKNAYTVTGGLSHNI